MHLYSRMNEFVKNNLLLTQKHQSFIIIVHNHDPNNNEQGREPVMKPE